MTAGRRNGRDEDFIDRTGAALVIGGSGGLGRAIVRMLGERGSAVVATYRSGREAAELAVSEAVAYGVRGEARALDTLDGEACTALVADVVATYGGLHSLVYAAGPHVPMRHLSKVDPADLDTQLGADAGAFFRVVSACLPALRESSGSVVAVTTAATSRFPVRDGLSSAPKAAVEALVRGLAVEEGRFGVRFNSVGPGMLTDGMADRLISSGELDERALEITRGNIPLRRFGQAVDIAEVVCFLASDRAGFISGQKIDVDGGYSA
ncbi:MAG TPA: SDR family oxidoreductase [Marmoricola sp.]|jgi:NAD(P)-dependent dehydrogenase (short-subunit alcohol dehydrogenase family)|nr:SDR family oxidoreductase [Marmoricola sp.]